MNTNNKIVVVLGPTASGKSDLAVALAQQFNGEVISADSRQVYAGMDLGTGKIKPSEMRGVKHYLLDVASPQRRFTVAQYKKLAQTAIKNIRRQGKLPIVCGGTGFYIQALVDDLAIPEVKPNLKLRARLEKLSAPQLFQQLKKLDLRRTKIIDRHNRRRLIRALEILIITGKPVPPLDPPQPSLKGGSDSPPLRGVRGDFNVLFLGIKPAPMELKMRIGKRLRKRLRQGLVAEVKRLRAQGLSWKRLDSFGLEYRWLAKYLQNKISYNEMAARLQADIEHYAKRQTTWFKRDPRINWIKKPPEAAKIVQRFLKSTA